MNIGVLLADLAPDEGGAHTFQEDIFHALTQLKYRHNVTVFNKTIGAYSGDALTAKVAMVSMQRNLWAKTKYVTRTASTRVAAGLLPKRKQRVPPSWFKELVNHHQIDLMWFPTPRFFDVDVPYIYTVFDLQHRLQPWFPEVSANGVWNERERVFSRAIPRASVLIAGTAAAQRDLECFYRVPPERVKLLPLPTPRFALDADTSDAYGILSKYNLPRDYLFYPAQFWPHKNHVVGLQAVKQLKEQHNLNFPLVFAGSDKGNLHHVRKMVNEQGLNSQVHFLGFVPQEDLPALYRQAFALLYITFFGPENLPPLEAFALGCPVIASNVAGAMEQLGDAALLVDPKNTNEIALAIKKLQNDRSLQQTLKQRGLKRASRWTANDFVKEIFKIIDEMVPLRRCWPHSSTF